MVLIAVYRGQELVFTRDLFVDSGIVHQSILLLALDTPLCAPPSYFAIDIGQYMVSPRALPPVLPCNIQYGIGIANIV